MDKTKSQVKNHLMKMGFSSFKPPVDLDKKHVERGSPTTTKRTKHIQCGPPKRDVNVGLKTPVSIVICVS